MPNCCIGVDVITGFPGETNEEFLETYQFLNELDISYLHVFTYSERENTHAINLGGKVKQTGRDERTTQLRNLSEKKKRFFYEQNLGTIQSVLFEADIKQGKMNGFTANYIKVSAKYDPLLVNETKTVELLSINEYGEVEISEIDEVLIH